jgi:DNA (cytosine-5)-methyltransferase 1
LNVLDLFSGIGGFSLGLERAGMRTVAFCEVEPYCRAVLRKHWPDVHCYDDVRTLTADRLRADGISVDVICGGFPCQDISIAGKGAGIEGERSGLWSEYARIIGEVRPRYVIVENVAALLGRGLDRVLGDLAALGFDAEWHCISASAVGAPHRRDRLWIVANPDEGGAMVQRRNRNSDDAKRDKTPKVQKRKDIEPGADEPGHVESDERRSRGWRNWADAQVPDAECAGLEGGPRKGLSGTWGASIELTGGHWWLTEPDVGRVANGVPSRVDRLRSLGNAVVPQIPEIIGRAIMTSLTAEQRNRE